MAKNTILACTDVNLIHMGTFRSIKTFAIGVVFHLKILQIFLIYPALVFKDDNHLWVLFLPLVSKAPFVSYLCGCELSRFPPFAPLNRA